MQEFPAPASYSPLLSAVYAKENAMPLALFDNPVITKELRGRMRGTRTYWLLFGYLLILSLILFFSYLGWSAQHSSGIEVSSSEAGFTVGRTFFKTLFYSQAVMMALIMPALTAGAISVEREQRTFELLRGSILRPGAIVCGKLVSAVSFVALLLTSSLPLLSLCFLLGGVSPGEVFFAYLLLLGDAFLFGAIGLCWSAFAANTATATVLSYLTLFLFFGVTFPFALPTFDTTGFTPNFGLCAVNPVGAVTGAVLPERYYGFTLPAWVAALLLNGTLTALLVLAAMNRLEDFPAKRAAALRLVTLLFAALLVFFGEGIAAGLPAGVGATSAGQLMVELSLACLVLLLFVPVLVTGDLKTGGGRSASRKKRQPWRMFSDATLSSGLPLALLLTAVVAGITLAAIHYQTSPAASAAFRPGSFGRGAGPRPYFAAPPSLPVSFREIGPQTAALLALLAAGISGFGYLLSVLLNNRWSSLTLVYLALILAAALPFFSYATLSGQDAAAAARSPGVNSLYLCPFVPLWQLADTGNPRPDFGRDSAVVGMIGYGIWPLWIGTGAVYLGIGLASYAAAALVIRRQKPVRTD